MYRLFFIALFTEAVASPVARSAETHVAPPSAANANARVPPVRYDSAFTGYQAYRDQRPAPWRASGPAPHPSRSGPHQQRLPPPLAANRNCAHANPLLTNIEAIR